jgi:hypothetical protein
MPQVIIFAPATVVGMFGLLPFFCAEAGTYASLHNIEEASNTTLKKSMIRY